MLNCCGCVAFMFMFNVCSFVSMIFWGNVNNVRGGVVFFHFQSNRLV